MTLPTRTQPMTPRCVVFDVDDTLYLERDYIKSGFHALDDWFVSEHGLPGFAHRAGGYFDRTYAGSFEDSVLGALETMGLQPDPALLDALLHVYCSHEPAIALADDARQCLESLHGDFPLAALTEGPVPSQHAKVEVLELNDWCTPIIYASRWGPRNQAHHERAFREVERRTGFVGQCVFVSHDPAAIETPRELGWSVARIRRPESRLVEMDTPEGIPEFEKLTDFALWLVLE